MFLELRAYLDTATDSTTNSPTGEPGHSSEVDFVVGDEIGVESNPKAGVSPRDYKGLSRPRRRSAPGKEKLSQSAERRCGAEPMMARILPYRRFSLRSYGQRRR